MAANIKILNLRCACCGGSAPALKQFHNQDRGYGVCPRCVNWISSREHNRAGSYFRDGVVGYIRATYGEYGVHHSVGMEVV